MIKGIAKVDRRTKNLCKRLKPGDIAVIYHRDIDEIAAEALVKAKIKAVINADISISCRYPNEGPRILVENGIKLIDNVGEDVFCKIKEGDHLAIDGEDIYCNEVYIGKGTVLDADKIEFLMEESYKNLDVELDRFIENTLEYAKREKEFFIKKIRFPKPVVDFKRRHVLVVVRGKDFREDLNALHAYIDEVKPILIGVDGGGDALLENGYIPDIIVGDMDSVSDRCLKSCKQIIVHAYPDGRAPGLKRVNELNLKSDIVPMPGTSEDIALLMAYEMGADLIVALGTHTNMIDFLEKGRKGMASTFLVRLKVGSKLMDAKGVNKLYRSGVKASYILGITVSALLPICVVFLMSPPMQQFLNIIRLRLKLILGI
ncbi:MAG: putative cytokinetic ring protein SteA [Thermoanaerobacteraceae bacterium]|nr:putative cytokinetic ring protein SteA [Thermoanaerobacteraceae bacterium]